MLTDTPVPARTLFLSQRRGARDVRGGDAQISAIAQRAARQAVESHGAGIDPAQGRRRFGQFGRLGHRESRDAYRRSGNADRSEQHPSELQSLMRISYAVFCLEKESWDVDTIHTS